MSYITAYQNTCWYAELPSGRLPETWDFSRAAYTKRYNSQVIDI